MTVTLLRSGRERERARERGNERGNRLLATLSFSFARLCTGGSGDSDELCKDLCERASTKLFVLVRNGRAGRRDPLNIK